MHKQGGPWGAQGDAIIHTACVKPAHLVYCGMELIRLAIQNEHIFRIVCDLIQLQKRGYLETQARDRGHREGGVPRCEP